MDMVKVGPAGIPGHTLWDEKGHGELAQIFISYDSDKVYSLQFLFYENGNLVLSNRHGIDGINNFNTVSFDYPSEFLTSIRGSFGIYGTTYLSSITFGTNKHTYGPFGKTPATTDDAYDFNFQMGNLRSFGGFHGYENHYGIRSIGVYVKPMTTSMIHSKEDSVKVKKEAEDY